MLLLDHVSSTTVGEPFRGQGAERQIIIFADNFAGGTVSLETSFDRENFSPLQYNFSNATFTSNISFTCPVISSQTYIRATFTGSGATNVTVFWG